MLRRHLLFIKGLTTSSSILTVSLSAILYHAEAANTAYSNHLPDHRHTSLLLHLPYN